MKFDAAFEAAIAGADAVSFVAALASRWPRRESFSFAHYTPRRGLAERLPPIDPPRRLFAMNADELLDLAAGDGGALMAKIVGPLVDGRKIQARLKLHFHEAGAIARHGVLKLVPPPSGQVVAFCSSVRLAAGTYRRFPLVDFRVGAPPAEDRAANARALELLCKALQTIEAPPGALLRSGNSFHYYGCEALTLSAWRRTMYRFLLLEPLVDVRYIAHRLPSSRAVLRLTDVTAKPHVPRVVATVRRTGFALHL
ncbi:MAG: hypothetical protein WDN08_01220 [Rhizomicrobium sp.]